MVTGDNRNDMSPVTTVNYPLEYWLIRLKSKIINLHELVRCLEWMRTF